MVGGLRDVITCAKFKIEIFIGYDFTGGRIFDFPIDFSMGLTTVQRYCAACDKLIAAQNLWEKIPMGVQVIPIPTEVVSHSLPFPFPILCFIPIPMRFP